MSPEVRAMENKRISKRRKEKRAQITPEACETANKLRRHKRQALDK